MMYFLTGFPVMSAGAAAQWQAQEPPHGVAEAAAVAVAVSPPLLSVLAGASLVPVPALAVDPLKSVAYQPDPLS